MATKPPAPKTAKIYKATLGSLGRVIRGEEITELEAVLERLAGRDIVVCEGGFKANRALRKIESQVGPCKEQPRIHISARMRCRTFSQTRVRPPATLFLKRPR